MNKPTNQQGFSAMPLIAAIAVIAALAFGGWYVWQRNKEDKSASTNTNDTSQQTQSSSQSNGTKEESKNQVKRFSCENTFSVAYPSSLQATVTDAGQCLISNVNIEEMPSVGPLPPNQLGLFFNIQAAEADSNSQYLEDYIERSQEDYPLELKAKEEIQLDNNTKAILATVYGGHPTPHDFYFFVYLKEGKAITTSYPVGSEHKEVALEVLRSIQ